MTSCSGFGLKTEPNNVGSIIWEKSFHKASVNLKASENSGQVNAVVAVQGPAAVVRDDVKF